MPRLGIGLMALGVIGTTALIGYNLQASAGATAVSISASVAALALLLTGYALLSRSLSKQREIGRVDHLANDVEQEARIHLLENREAELRRQIETLERRRDATLAEMGHAYETTREEGQTRPKLVVVSSAD
jgi:hypothetical protein